MPIPNTQELFRVVTSEALGAPDGALAVPVAPMAFAPLVPEVSTPVKLRTVMDDTTLCDTVAVTDTLLSGALANALQISAVPLCTFVRLTSVQFSAPPVIPKTVVLVPER